MRRYRPRHARRQRPAGLALSVLAVTAVCTGTASQATAASAPRAPQREPVEQAAPAPPSRTFTAAPVVEPLVSSSRMGVPATAAPPSARALLLPASEGVALGMRWQQPTPSEIAAYRAAAAQAGCALPWTVLAGIAAVVSDHGRRAPGQLLDGSHGVFMSDSDHGRYDGSARLDGPVGPFGLLPWTFVRVRATADADPRDLTDAADAAARFLCAAGEPGRLRQALRAYDPQPGFVSRVLAVTREVRAAR